MVHTSWTFWLCHLIPFHSSIACCISTWYFSDRSFMMSKLMEVLHLFGLANHPPCLHLLTDQTSLDHGVWTPFCCRFDFDLCRKRYPVSQWQMVVDWRPLFFQKRRWCLATNFANLDHNKARYNKWKFCGNQSAWALNRQTQTPLFAKGSAPPQNIGPSEVRWRVCNGLQFARR